MTRAHDRKPARLTKCYLTRHGITAESLRSRSVEEGDGCWLWRGKARGHVPTIYVGVRADGRYRGVSARRAAAALRFGEAPKDVPVRTTCGETRCVNPAHMKLSSPSEIGRIAGRQGLLSTISRRLAISRAKRARSWITPDMRSQIIGAAHGDVHAVCKALGVKYGTGKAIRARREMTSPRANPWAGLMR